MHWKIQYTFVVIFCFYLNLVSCYVSLMIKNTYSDISLAEMQNKRNQPDTVLVDVRENWEFEEFNEGGINIPLAEIRQHKDVLEPYKTIILICTNGVRSKVAAMDFCRVPEWMDRTILHVKGGIIETT